MTEGPKERVYDEAISPLMNQIVEICQREHIALAATFELDPLEGNRENPRMCTTTMVTEDSCKIMRLTVALLEPGGHCDGVAAITMYTSSTPETR